MEESIRIILEAVERAKGVLTQTVADIDRVTAATKQQQGAFTKIKGVLREHDRLFFRLKIAAAAAAAAFVLLIKRALESAESLNKQADALSVTTERLSELRFAASLANINSQELASSLDVLQRALADAQKPGSEMAAVFKHLNVATTDAVGKIRDPISVLLDLADAFQRSEGAAVKADIAQKLFGRGSREFIAFLNQGSAALKAQAVEAGELGNVLTKQTAQGANDFNTSLTRLRAGITGLTNQILAELLPTLLSLSAELVKIEKEQIASGRGASTLSEQLKFAAKGVIIFTGGLQALAQVVGVGISIHINFLINLFTAVVQIGAVLGETIGKLVTSFFNLGKALIEVIKQATIFGDVFQKIISGDFKAAFDAGQAAIRNLGSTAKVVGEDFSAIFGKVAKIVREKAALTTGQTKVMVEDTLANIEALAERTARLLRAINAPSALPGAPPKVARTTLEPVPDSKAAQDALKLRAQIAAETGKALAERKEADASILESGIQTDKGIVESARLRQEALAILLDAELAAEVAANAQRNAEIDTLGISQEEKDNLREEEAQRNQERITAIERKGAADRVKIEALTEARKKTIRQDGLESFSSILGSAAAIARTFGKKGFLAYKALAIAEAVIAGTLAVLKQLGSGDPYSAPFRAIAAGIAAAAQIATIVATTVSYAEGGLVPGTPSRRDNRIATVATGEYIFDSDTVSAMGPSWFAKLHEMIRMGELPGFQGGGLVPRPVVSSSFGSTTSAARQATAADTNVTVGFVNSRNSQRDFMRQEGVRIVADELRKRSNRISS